MTRPPRVGPSVSLTRGPRVSGSVPLQSTTTASAPVVQPPTVVIIAESFYYRHSQAAPASEWTIVHNLGKRPNISVFVGGDEVLVPVQHLDDNTAHIIWPAPTAGEAYCS